MCFYISNGFVIVRYRVCLNKSLKKGITDYIKFVYKINITCRCFCSCKSGHPVSSFQWIISQRPTEWLVHEYTTLIQSCLSHQLTSWLLLNNFWTIHFTNLLYDFRKLVISAWLMWTTLIMLFNGAFMSCFWRLKALVTITCNSNPVNYLTFSFCLFPKKKKRHQGFSIFVFGAILERKVLH